MRVVWAKRQGDGDGGTLQIPLLPSGHLPLDEIAAALWLAPSKLVAGDLFLARDSSGASELTLDEISSLLPPTNNGLSKQSPLLITVSAAADQQIARPSAEQEFEALAAAVPAFSWPVGGEPSKEALREYLLDFDCLAGRVPLAGKSFCQESKAFFHSESELAISLVSVMPPPMAGSAVNCRFVEYCKILDCMRRCSSMSHRLAFHFSMGNAEEASEFTSTQLGKRKRPDFLFEQREILFLLGEGTDSASDFYAACDEIRLKLAKMPAWVFGDVSFLLAFAVAGFRWQLFVKRGSCDEPEAIVEEFDLSSFKDRLKLSLLFIKLYFVCLSMVQKINHTGMLQLFKKHERDFSTIELDAQGCVKVIERWVQFKSEFGVALSEIQKAYSVKAAQLVFAVVPPAVRRGIYSVRTGPLGLPATVKSVSDCKQLARDMLAALAALHAAEIVHRDIRLDNIVWSPDMKCYVLIDLECCCRNGSKMTRLLTDYTSHTLVDGKYTHTSDLYQLGVLMTDLTPLRVPDEQCRDFIAVLQSHKRRGSAQKMLSHAWLSHL